MVLTRRKGRAFKRIVLHGGRLGPLGHPALQAVAWGSVVENAFVKGHPLKVRLSVLLFLYRNVGRIFGLYVILQPAFPSQNFSQRYFRRRLVPYSVWKIEPIGNIRLGEKRLGYHVCEKTATKRPVGEFAEGNVGILNFW